MQPKGQRKGRKCKQCKAYNCIHEKTDGDHLSEEQTVLEQNVLEDKLPEDAAEITSKDELLKLGMEPICIIAAVGHVAGIQNLLNKGVDLNRKRPSDGNTPLMLAVQNKHMEVVELILNHSGDVTAVNNDGYNSFMIAIGTGDAKVVNMVWQFRGNLNINHRNNKGDTALHFAVEKSWDACVNFLIGNGAAIGSQNKDDTSPLILASMKGDIKIVNRLVTAGANLFLEDKHGLTAVCWAAVLEKDDLMFYFLNKVSQQNYKDFYIKNRMDRMKSILSEEDLFDFLDTVLPLLRKMTDQDVFRDVLVKQKVIPNVISVVQKHLKVKDILSEAVLLFCGCMYHTDPDYIDERFVQQFLKSRGCEFCLKALKLHSDENKRNNELLIAIFLPIVCARQIPDGKTWIEKNSSKLTSYVFLREQFVKYSIIEDSKKIWAQFWEHYNELQKQHRDRKMAELLEEEERERSKKVKKREKKKQKRIRQQSVSVAEHVTGSPCNTEQGDTTGTEIAGERRSSLLTEKCDNSSGTKTQSCSSKDASEDRHIEASVITKDCASSDIIPSMAEAINDVSHFEYENITENAKSSKKYSRSTKTKHVLNEISAHWCDKDVSTPVTQDDEWVTIQTKKQTSKSDIKSFTKESNPPLNHIKPIERHTPTKRWADVAKVHVNDKPKTNEVSPPKNIVHHPIDDTMVQVEEQHRIVYEDNFPSLDAQTSPSRSSPSSNSQRPSLDTQTSPSRSSPSSNFQRPSLDTQTSPSRSAPFSNSKRPSLDTQTSPSRSSPSSNSQRPSLDTQTSPSRSSPSSYSQRRRSSEVPSPDFSYLDEWSSDRADFTPTDPDVDGIHNDTAVPGFLTDEKEENSSVASCVEDNSEHYEDGHQFTKSDLETNRTENNGLNSQDKLPTYFGYTWNEPLTENFYKHRDPQGLSFGACNGTEQSSTKQHNEFIRNTSIHLTYDQIKQFKIETANEHMLKSDLLENCLRYSPNEITQNLDQNKEPEALRPAPSIQTTPFYFQTSDANIKSLIVSPTNTSECLQWKYPKTGQPTVTEDVCVNEQPVPSLWEDKQDERIYDSISTSSKFERENKQVERIYDSISISSKFERENKQVERIYDSISTSYKFDRLQQSSLGSDNIITDYKNTERVIETANRLTSDKIAVIQPLSESFDNRSQSQDGFLVDSSMENNCELGASLLRNLSKLQFEDDEKWYPSRITQDSESSSNTQIDVFPGFHDSTSLDNATTESFLNACAELKKLTTYQLQQKYNDVRKRGPVYGSLFYHDIPFYASCMGISEHELERSFVSGMATVPQQRPFSSKSSNPDAQANRLLETPMCQAFTACEDKLRVNKPDGFTHYPNPGIDRSMIEKSTEIFYPYIPAQAYAADAGSPEKRTMPEVTPTENDVLYNNILPVQSVNRIHNGNCNREMLPRQHAVNISNSIQPWIQRSVRWRPKLIEIRNLPPSHLKHVGEIIIPVETEKFSIPYSDTNAIIGFLTDGTEVLVQKVDVTYRTINSDIMKVILSPRTSQYFLIKYRTFAFENGICYIAMELPEYSLTEYLQLLRSDAHANPMMVNKLAWQFLKGLSSLHDGLGWQHGNMTPSNIFVDTESKLMLSEYSFIKPESTKGKFLGLNLVEYDKLCWTPTEVLTETEEYSKQSDIQVAGMILHYILAGGVHPYGEINLEIQVSLQQNWPKPTYISDEVNGLIEDMLVMPASSRPTMNQILKHPYFWANEKRLRFVLISGSDVLRDMKSGTSTTGGAGGTMIDIINSVGGKHYSFGEWTSVVDQVILKEMRSFRQYKNTLVELVLFVYNCCLHFDKLSQTARDIIDEPCKYFLSTFPALFMAVFTAIKNSFRAERVCYKPFF